jgi:nitroimidazol reductase NimA-like FMN-containing flavoprotein (pyridoxamine 5'-phosphate oxidase superfamily)
VLIHTLTRAECDAVLARASIGRLACARDDQPYLVPLHVAFDGYHLYGVATVGQKVEWMRQNPRVCVEVDEIADPGLWTTVLVFGEYEEVPPSEKEARMWAQRLLESREAYWRPATARVTTHEHFSPVVYRIRISSVTGRRASRG